MAKSDAEGLESKAIQRTELVAAAMARSYERAKLRGYAVEKGTWVDGELVNGVEFHIEDEALFWIRDRGTAAPEVYWFKPGVLKYVERG